MSKWFTYLKGYKRYRDLPAATPPESLEAVRICAECDASRLTLVEDRDFLDDVALRVAGYSSRAVLTCGKPGIEDLESPNPTCGCPVGADADECTPVELTITLPSGRRIEAAGKTEVRDVCPRGKYDLRSR